MRAATFLVLLLPAMAMADVPGKLAYQGRLLRADGTPEVNIVSLKLSVFDAATGGTAKWSESYTVAPTNGYYAVYLGEVTPLPADLFDGSDRWLEVEVGAPLAPRQYIGSVAHAITCKNVSGGTVNATNIQLNGKPVVAGRPAGPNLLVNTLTFSHIPAGLSNVTASRNWGAWRYYAYSAAKAEILVEDPPAELLDIVQPGAEPWWPRAFKVLHLKFSAGGGDAGRLLQLAAASDKQGPVTMSAYVKVVGSGQLSMGQEFSWKPLTNSTWQRVAVTDASPKRTLGGAYGFAGQAGVYTEAYVALPKVELGEAATPYLEAARDAVPTTAQLFSAASWDGGLAGGRTTSPFTTSGGSLMVFASGSGYHSGASQIGMEILLDGTSIGFAKAFTNEASSHKALTATTLVARDVAAGAHAITLKPWNGTISDFNDFFNVAVMEVP